MSAPIRDFRDLIVWQRSMELAEAVYAMTRTMSGIEAFGLIPQLRRCAVSIPSNIAEGNGRRTRKDYIAFLYIARGSLAELRTQTELARRLGLAETDANISELTDQVSRMLNALISSLRNIRD